MSHRMSHRHGLSFLIGMAAGALASQQPWHGLRILIAAATDSKPETQIRVMRSMRHIDATFSGTPAFAAHRAYVDWSLCAYDDKADHWDMLMTNASEIFRNTRLVSVVNASAPGTSLSAAQRRARGVHRRRAVVTAWNQQGTGRWDAVWLTDSDISFEDFHLGAFLERRWCALGGGVPLIVQPVIRQNTQCWPYNHNSYAASTTPRSQQHAERAAGAPPPAQWEGWDAILMLRLGWVESQSVLFDASFLRWFYEQPTTRVVLGLQLDTFHVSWGTDALWCGAALEYSARYLHDTRASCAVIPVPIEHHNTRSIGAKGSSYIHDGFRLLEQAGILAGLGGSKHRACAPGDAGPFPGLGCARIAHRWWSPFANQACLSRRPVLPSSLGHVQQCASTQLARACTDAARGSTWTAARTAEPTGRAGRAAGPDPDSRHLPLSAAGAARHPGSMRLSAPKALGDGTAAPRSAIALRGMGGYHAAPCHELSPLFANWTGPRDHL